MYGTIDPGHIYDEYLVLLAKSGMTPLIIWSKTSGSISVGMVKLGQDIEKHCSDVLAHTLKVCKGISSDQRVPSYQG
jgi:hypothetical protein